MERDGLVWMLRIIAGGNRYILPFVLRSGFVYSLLVDRLKSSL